MDRINRRSFLHKTAYTLSGLALSSSLSSFDMAQHKIELPLFDVIIVGGSYSGLAAALTLGRSQRKVLIIDSGNPCNKVAPHSHNFLTQDGRSPSDISHTAKQDVMKYPTVSWLDDRVTVSKFQNNVFTIETANNKKILGKRVLFATGIRDIMPELPGFSACWGKSVLHCPYCHGYEFKGKKIGILGDANTAFHYALLVKNYSTEIQIFSPRKDKFDTAQQAALTRNNIEIITNPIRKIQHEDGWLNIIELDNGQKIARDVLFTRPQSEQHCSIPSQLGCELTEQGLIKTNSNQQTTVRGIYACGDNSAFRSIPIAVATGSTAGAAINMDLAIESF
ncbi:NAD(P)/FAD-dependent oxidoreductase [Sphingobacterium tabacisoli]|uniref:NAD(P)/FAD-dependent oxidoreductase n=1 Tax=Sphingobacterium tabacisoli TaxID=2044855 RepID=A0ABW5L4P7_9SPHI|nr:NAD(P)/FAD-dependent oxidoreductase [Sphingobacterium tabacisoli]